MLIWTTRLALLLSLLLFGPSPTAATDGATDSAAAGTLSGPTEPAVYRVRPDPRMCPSPLCGGAFASLVNLANTPCIDGVDREACYVADVDLGAMGLSDSQLSELRNALFGGRAFLDGWIDGRAFGSFGTLGELHGVRGWQAATDAVPAETPYRVRDNGVRCIAAPCFSYDAVAINTSAVLTVSDVDLSAVGATPAQVASAQQALSTGGLLVSGTIQPRPNAGPAGTGQTLVATQFYLAVPISASSSGALSGSVAFQGRGSAGDPRWAVPLSVRLFQPGSNYVVLAVTPTTSSSGGFAVAGIPPGRYDVEVKQSQSLSRRAVNLGFTAGATTTQGFGTLPTGDVTEHNAVSLQDFSAVSASYGRSQGQPGFDRRADLNASNVVDLSDFSLLSANFGRVGPLAVGVP